MSQGEALGMKLLDLLLPLPPGDLERFVSASLHGPRRIRHHGGFNLRKEGEENKNELKK